MKYAHRAGCICYLSWRIGSNFVQEWLRINKITASSSFGLRIYAAVKVHTRSMHNPVNSARVPSGSLGRSFAVERCGLFPKHEIHKSLPLRDKRTLTGQRCTVSLVNGKSECPPRSRRLLLHFVLRCSGLFKKMRKTLSVENSKFKGSWKKRENRSCEDVENDEGSQRKEDQASKPRSRGLHILAVRPLGRLSPFFTEKEM